MEAVYSEDATRAGTGVSKEISARFRKQLRGASRGARSCSHQPPSAETSGSNVKGIGKRYSLDDV